MLTPGIVAITCVGQSKQSNGLLPTISPPLGASVIIDSLSISPYLQRQLGSEISRERERERETERERRRETDTEGRERAAAAAAAERNTKMQYGENGIIAVHKMSQNRRVAFLNFDMDLALWVCHVSHKPTE